MNRFFSLPLRIHLLLLVILLTLPAAGVITYSGLSQRKAARHEATQQVLKLAYTIASEQKDLVTASEQLLSTLTLIPDIRNRNVAATNAILADLLAKNPHYANIFVADMSGALWSSAVPHTHAVSHAGYRYLTDAIATGRFSSGEYATGKITRKKVLHFGYPLRDPSGRITGVAAVALDLEYCWHLLGKAGLPPKTSLTLVDHNGTIVSRSLNNQFVGSPDKASLFRIMNEGPREGAFQAVGLDGTTRLFAYNKLHLHGEQTPYLYIRAGIPEQAIVAQANSALLQNLLVLAPFPLLGLCIIWLIGKKAIVDRVATLQGAVQRLAGGDLEVRVSNLVTGGELGSLGLAFDDMAESLARRDKELRESQQENAFLTGLLEHSSQPFAIAYPDGRIGRFNPAFLALLGYGSEELRTLDWIGELTPSDWRAREQEKLLELEHSDQPVRYEKEYLRKDGSRVPVELLTHVVREPDGRPAFYYAFITDITERRHAQREMLKTDKLESLGVLAGGIAHDFNNILTAILGNISLAQMYVNDPDALSKRLEDAENAAVRAKGLTRQLLTFARGGEPVKKFVQIRKLLEEAVGFATVGSKVTYEVLLKGDFWVEADEGQLSQAFHNLVLNAVQAMPEGGALVIRADRVRTGPDRKPILTITVTDTGIGIPEYDLPRIFDPYFTTKQQGNGLGLATCHSIITRHGGTISVTSAPGQGSTFLVTLPALELGDATDAELRHEAAQGRGRILVMDDEAPVREIARSMLDSLGYAAECAADGDDAVRLYQERKEEGMPFAAVIMDLTIPGGRGGKEVLASLLSIDPEVRAIVSSGYAEDPVMANFREYGFSAVLGKPYLLHELSAVLREVLPEQGENRTQG